MHRSTLVPLLLLALACGTTGHRATPYQDVQASPQTSPASVDVLMSEPDRPFEKLGAVSVKRYKPGWSDPTVTDARAEIQAAGAKLGADAVIVLSSQSANRSVLVEGEAIRYLDQDLDQER